ncbi:hypothetical protein MGSAQ_003280 [marine sediment metagenome]|uniref:Uncharacterized protein n=1 Tax=marine sediment metagenome TaxID=412755 RepID=A0A1B6NPI5_9ZZZZ
MLNVWILCNSVREYSEILKIKTKKRACSALKIKEE